MTNTTAPTAQALTVVKDGSDWNVVGSDGEVLSGPFASRKDAREAKADLEAGIDVTAVPTSTELVLASEAGLDLQALTEQVLTQAEAITIAADEEEWVPAEDDTTETGEAPAVETEVEDKPKKAKKVHCSGSSTYVGYWDEDVTERTKKGRAAWALTHCPGCKTKVRAGVWYTEKGQALNGDRGLAYLPKH